MASTREERMQQRLRGAQRRQVKDVDFGLTFAPAPAPALAVPSAPPAPTRRSPRRSLELAAQPSTRPTPATRSRSQPPISTPADENVPPGSNQSGTDPSTSAKHANISAKRRKLNNDEASMSVRSSQSTIPTTRGDVYALEEDEQPETEAAEITNGSIEQSRNVHNTAEFDISMSELPAPAGEEEITESPTHAPGSGQRTRTTNRGAKQSSRLQDKLQVNNTAQNDPVGSPTPQTQRKRKRPTSNSPGTAKSHRTSIGQASKKAYEAIEVDELSPDQSKRGRRRRSSIQQESLVDAVAKVSANNSRESAEEIDDAQAASILKKNRGRRVSRRAPAEPSPDLDESLEPIPRTAKRQGRLQPTTSPAKQRHPRKANRKSKPAKNPAKAQIRSRSPIPVTVYRLTKAPIYNEDEDDVDILNSEIPHSKRGGANVIDVLNTLCSEIIKSAFETLKDSSRNAEDAAMKREYRNKHKVVDIFWRDFQDRLLEHTINLDNAGAVERRVREEQKERQVLWKEISQVKAERDQIAVRMDAVRIKNERESKYVQDRDTLNNAVHDIELAVERGRERNPNDPALGPGEKVGTELLLKRIAGEVSNKSDSGGILKQIKDFNAFLERAALLLEGRKA